MVNIHLPNHVAIPMVRVTECEDNDGDFDFVIGMNVLTLGDFAITNKEGKTYVSFRIPSLEHIDFTNRQSKTKDTSTAKAERDAFLKRKPPRKKRS